MGLDFINERPYPPGENNISGIYEAAAAYGTALGAHASDKTKLSLAGGKNFKGFLTRAVTLTGPVLTDIVFAGTRAEGPFKAGEEVSLEQSDEAQIGAALCVSSGTGAISGSTAVDTALSFSGGKVYVAQSGDFIRYKLAAQLDAVDGEAFRIRIERAP